jgi:hypothetical protein
MVNGIERIQVLRDDRVQLPKFRGRCREAPKRLKRAAGLAYFDQEPHAQSITSGVEKSACLRDPEIL